MNSIREEFAVTSLAMDLTKDLVATGCFSENKINFWKISSQTKVKSILFDKAFNPINSILFFKNNIAFIANSATNAIILHGDNFEEVQKFSRNENREIVAISHSQNEFMLACQRPLLQTLNYRKAQDIYIYDSSDWKLKYEISSNYLIFDAKISNQLLIYIGLDDDDGLFKCKFIDLNNTDQNIISLKSENYFDELILNNDAYSAQLSINDQSQIISIILRDNDNKDGSMYSTLFLVDSKTRKTIFKNTVSGGDDYLNCQVINDNKFVIDYYDHLKQTSFIKIINNEGLQLSELKVDGITTYGIATSESLVALAVNNYVEFLELY